MLPTVCNLDISSVFSRASAISKFQVVMFLCNGRYYLGEWFNLVESHGRYLDDLPIQLTSEVCETWVCNHIREELWSKVDFIYLGYPHQKNLGPNIEFLLPAGWACQRLGSSTVPNQTEVSRALFNRSCVAMSRACAKLTECDVVDLVLWYLGVSRAAICTLQIRHLVLRCLTRCRPGWLWNIAFLCDAGFGFESSQDSTAASSIVLPKRISTVLLFA